MGKKKAGLAEWSVEKRRQVIEPELDGISIARQCELLDLARSSYYYELCPESAENLALMRLIDEQYLTTPFYGYRRMAAHLRMEGHGVGEERIRRLMRLMGLEAIYQKPRTSIPNKEHIVYPYLLRNVPIERVGQVWSTDITYVPMRRGFLYLTAVIDWYSRFVLSWRLSNSMDTSPLFTGILKDKNIRISMDGRGRAIDNVFCERLWRSVKYECLYLHSFETVAEVRSALTTYFDLHNHRKPHQALSYKTPFCVFEAGRSNLICRA